MYLEFVCPVCDDERLVLAGGEARAYFAVCGACGYQVLFSWCPSCGAGGGMPLSGGERPQRRFCPVCRSSYRIPAAVYSHPVAAFPPAPPAGPAPLARWFLRTMAALAGILLAGYILTRL